MRRWRVDPVTATATVVLLSCVPLPFLYLFAPSGFHAAASAEIVSQMVIQGFLAGAAAMFLYTYVPRSRRLRNRVGVGRHLAPPELGAAGEEACEDEDPERLVERRDGCPGIQGQEDDEGGAVDGGRAAAGGRTGEPPQGTCRAGPAGCPGRRDDEQAEDECPGRDRDEQRSPSRSTVGPSLSTTAPPAVDTVPPPPPSTSRRVS